MKPNKVVVEVPSEWINDFPGGPRNYTFFYHFILSLLNCDIKLELVKHKPGSMNYKRVAQPGEMLFSYFSHNQAPNTFCVKEAPLPGLYLIDKSGYLCWSEKCNNLDSTNDTSCIVDWQNKLRTKASKYNQQGTFIKPNNKYVFLPLQNVADDVHVSVDQVEVLTKLAKVCQQNGIDLVVKIHPLVKSMNLESFVTRLGNHVHLCEGPVYDMYVGAEVTVTINSAVGLEALIMGNKVVTLDACEWQHCTNQLTVDTLDGVFDLPSITLQQQQKLNWLLAKYWLDINDRQAIQQRVNELIATYQPVGYSVNSIDNTVMYAETLLGNLNSSILDFKRVTQELKMHTLLNKE